MNKIKENNTSSTGSEVVSVLLLSIVQFVCIVLGVQWFYNWFISGVFQELPIAIDFNTACITTVVVQVFISLFQVGISIDIKNERSKTSGALAKVVAVWITIGIGYLVFKLLF